MISVVILTKNEESRIGGCIKSVFRVIVIYDTGEEPCLNYNLS